MVPADGDPVRLNENFIAFDSINFANRHEVGFVNTDKSLPVKLLLQVFKV